MGRTVPSTTSSKSTQSCSRFISWRSVSLKWPTLVFYAAVDIMLGTTAYLTQSILPGIVTHAVGLLVFFTLVWPGDVLRTALGHGGTTVWLWIHAAQTLVFAVLAILAFIQLARGRSAGEKWSGPDEREGYTLQPG